MTIVHKGWQTTGLQLILVSGLSNHTLPAGCHSLCDVWCAIYCRTISLIRPCRGCTRSWTSRWPACSELLIPKYMYNTQTLSSSQWLILGPAAPRAGILGHSMSLLDCSILILNHPKEYTPGCFHCASNIPRRSTLDNSFFLFQFVIDWIGCGPLSVQSKVISVHIL